MTLLQDEDRHAYILWSLIICVASLALVLLDTRPARVFSVVGGLINLAGAYWIAAGVVLRAKDYTELAKASFSGGLRYIGADPQKQIIPNMLKVQSRRAQVGVACVSVGTICQTIGAYCA